MKRTALILHFCLYLLPLAAQKYNFINYSLSEGLSQSQVLSMCQDSKGNIWFGTHGGGADKFDGKSFTNYTIADGLNNNKVFSIMGDSRGNVWMGTWGGGVNKYDGKNFTHITEKDSLPSNIVRAIFEDTKGNIWFGTYLGVSKLPHGELNYDSTGSLKIINYTVKDGLGANYIWSITEDNYGNIWVAHQPGGVSKLIVNDDNDSVKFINYTEKDGLSNNRAGNVFADSKGNIWVGTDGGANKIIPGNGESAKIINYTKKSGCKSFLEFIRSEIKPLKINYHRENFPQKSSLNLLQ